MAKIRISNKGFSRARETVKIKALIPDRTLMAKFIRATSFRDINILLYNPEVVKFKFPNIRHSDIKDKVSEEIKKLHPMKDEPLAPTAVIARHPGLWKWAHTVFTNWEAAIAYTAEKFPELHLSYAAIQISYQMKRKEVVEEIIRLLKSGKLSETSTGEWTESNFRETHERAGIYYGGWEEAFNTALGEFHKKRFAVFFPKARITRSPWV